MMSISDLLKVISYLLKVMSTLDERVYWSSRVGNAPKRVTTGLQLTCNNNTFVICFNQCIYDMMLITYQKSRFMYQTERIAINGINVLGVKFSWK